MRATPAGSRPSRNTFDDTSDCPYRCHGSFGHLALGIDRVEELVVRKTGHRPPRHLHSCGPTPSRRPLRPPTPHGLCAAQDDDTVPPIATGPATGIEHSVASVSGLETVRGPSASRNRLYQQGVDIAYEADSEDHTAARRKKNYRVQKGRRSSHSWLDVDDLDWGQYDWSAELHRQQTFYDMFFKNLLKTSRRSSQGELLPTRPSSSSKATPTAGQPCAGFEPERAILPAQEEIERKRDTSKLAQMLGGEINASASSIASSTKLAKLLGTDLSMTPTDAYNIKRSSERLLSPNLSRQSLLAREYGIDLEEFDLEKVEETPSERHFEFMELELAPTEPDTAPTTSEDEPEPEAEIAVGVPLYYDAPEFPSVTPISAPAHDEQILSLTKIETAVAEPVESAWETTEAESDAEALQPAAVFEHRGSHDSSMTHDSLPPLTQAPSLESEASPEPEQQQREPEVATVAEDYFNSARFERAADLSSSSESSSPAETIAAAKAVSEQANTVELDHFAIVCERLMSELDEKLERAASAGELSPPASIPVTVTASSSTSTSTSPSLFQATEPSSPISSCSSAESSLKNVRVAFRAAETSLSGDKMAEQRAAKAKLAAARDALKRVRSNIIVPVTEQELAPALGLRMSSSMSSPNLGSQLSRSRQNSITSNKSSSSLSSLISESDKSERSRPRSSRRSRTFDSTTAPIPRRAEITIGVAQPRNLDNAQSLYKAANLPGSKPQKAMTHAHPRVPGRPSTGTPVVRQGAFGGQSSTPSTLSKSKSSGYIPQMHNIHEVLA